MWCITGFTRDNGPLRVIPGSHHAAHDPADDMEFPGMGPHPDEVKLRLAVTTYLSALAKPPSA
jgi:ectoine hydroxylase-related dioxygenase (phytanoyl-CoA dioxygenase family)